MSEEKKMILNMLKEGKITDEEALKLLEAIGNKDKDNQKDELDSQEKKFEKSANNFVSKIISGVDSFINKVEDTLSNVNLDIDKGSINFGYDSFNQSTERIFSLNELSYDSIININNTNGKIDIMEWDKDYGELKALIKYNDKNINEDFEFIIEKIVDNEISYEVNNSKSFANSNKDFKVNLELYLPKIKLDKINLDTINGKVTIKGIEANSLSADTVNGSIKCISNTISKLKIDSVNGKFDLVGGIYDDLDIDLVNGKVNISELNSKETNIDNMNGLIHINEILSSTSNLNVESHNGGVYLSDLDYTRPIKINCKGRIEKDDISSNFTKFEKYGNTLTASTDNYEQDNPNNLNIVINSSYGRISID